VLKKIKQQKIKEDYNDLAKKVSLQREYAKKQQKGLSYLPKFAKKNSSSRNASSTIWNCASGES
jgi:hypothetical protein